MFIVLLHVKCLKRSTYEDVVSLLIAQETNQEIQTFNPILDPQLKMADIALGCFNSKYPEPLTKISFTYNELLPRCCQLRLVHRMDRKIAEIGSSKLSNKTEFNLF